MTRSVPSTLAVLVLARLAGRPRRQLDGHRAAGQLLRLQIAGDRETVARIGPGGSHEIADADVGRPAIGADADGEDGNLGVAGGVDGRLRVDAGVLPAVAEQDDAGDRHRAFFVDQVAHGLAQAAFRSLAACSANFQSTVGLRRLWRCGVGRRTAAGRAIGLASAPAGQLGQRHDTVGVGVEAGQDHVVGSAAAC